MTTIEVTGNDIYEAMHKNGYTKLKNGNYIKYNLNTKTVVAACAMGQAAANLGVLPGALSEAIHALIHINLGFLFVENDETYATVPELADKYLGRLKGDENRIHIESTDYYEYFAAGIPGDDDGFVYI